MGEREAANVSDLVAAGFVDKGEKERGPKCYHDEIRFGRPRAELCQVARVSVVGFCLQDQSWICFLTLKISNRVACRLWRV